MRLKQLSFDTLESEMLKVNNKSLIELFSFETFETKIKILIKLGWIMKVDLTSVHNFVKPQRILMC